MTISEQEQNRGTGDADKARELAQKLDPKYVSPEELRATFGGPAAVNKKGANSKS